MNSKERVLTAIHLQQAERVYMDLQAIPWFMNGCIATSELLAPGTAVMVTH